MCKVLITKYNSLYPLQYRVYCYTNLISCSLLWNARPVSVLIFCLYSPSLLSFDNKQVPYKSLKLKKKVRS